MYQNRKFNPDEEDIDAGNAFYGTNKDLEPTPLQLIGSVYGAERSDLSFSKQGPWLSPSHHLHNFFSIFRRIWYRLLCSHLPLCTLWWFVRIKVCSSLSLLFLSFHLPELWQRLMSLNKPLKIIPLWSRTLLMIALTLRYSIVFQKLVSSSFALGILQILFEVWRCGFRYNRNQ